MVSICNDARVGDAGVRDGPNVPSAPLQLSLPSSETALLGVPSSNIDLAAD
jgi:hypothetical protein